MKPIATTSRRAAALAAALFLVPALASAKDHAPVDAIAQLLGTSGGVPVKAAGPYVEVGSYRIHVLAHLGRPNAVLADGTWLYHDFTAEDSAANGTMMVRFVQGRVSELALISRRVETAMFKSPANSSVAIRVASK